VKRGHGNAVNDTNGICTLSRKFDVISSVQKDYCALGLAEIRFRSNVFSNKCSKSDINNIIANCKNNAILQVAKFPIQFNRAKPYMKTCSCKLQL